MSGLPKGIRRVYSDADGLLMDQQNLPVGWTSNGIDRFVAIVKTDPVTGGITTSGGKGIAPFEIGKNNGLIRLGNTSKITAALESATAANPIKIVRIGDSTTAGAGSGNDGTWGSASVRNCSAQFCDLTSGVVRNVSMCSDNLIDAGFGSYTAYYDPRVTIGAGWQNLTATLGGYFFRMNDGALGAMRIQKHTGATRIRFYSYWIATAQIRTNLGELGQIGGYTSAMGINEFVLPAGVTWVEIYGNSTTFLIHTIAFLDDVQKALLFNAGGNGCIASWFAGDAENYDSLPVLRYYAPALTVIALTINDSCNGTAIATYQSSLVAIVEAALASGDAALEISAVSSHATSTDGGLFAVRKALLEVADAYNLTVLSLPAAIGGYAGANASGYMFDWGHPSYTGYAQEAQKVWLPFWNAISAGRV